MIRLAALADVHFNTQSRGRLRPHLDEIADQVDVLLIAGDLTSLGTFAEAQVLAEELAGYPVPTVAVLGNHDFHADEQVGVAAALAGAGVQVLEGTTTTVDADDATIGVAGVKGFGGGFAGACGSDFGEPEMKAFMRHTKDLAGRLREALAGLSADVTVALLHYAPVPETLEGERLEIWPFLGSHLLGEAIDESHCDLVLHGHAHAGTEEGKTPGGVPVRNVAQQVLGQPVVVYEVAPGTVRRVD